MATVTCMRSTLRNVLAALALVLPLSSACESDSLKPAPLTENQLYWDIALNHYAIVLSTTAPYDTLTLAVTPRNVRREPLTGSPAPRFLSRDADRVVVGADGVIRAISAGSEPVWVVASLTWGELTYTDSVYVKVVDEPSPPTLAHFSIHPIPPDSAKVAATFFRSPVLPVQATDGDGVPVPNVVVSFRSSDPTIATVHRTDGNVFGWLPGAVMIDATTTVYGVTKADTVRYRIGWPVTGAFGIWQNVSPTGLPPGLYPTAITVGAGALIFFLINDVKHVETDILFDEEDAPNVVAANTSTVLDSSTLEFYCSALKTDCDATGSFVVSADTTQGGAVRVFSAPGTYDFHSVKLGINGRIVVVDERE